MQYKEIEIIKKYYEETKSLRRTAKFFCTTAYKLKKVLKANNFELKTKSKMGRVRTYDLNDIQKRISNGEDTKAIAVSLGITLFSLRTMLSQNKKRGQKCL